MQTIDRVLAGLRAWLNARLANRVIAAALAVNILLLFFMGIGAYGLTHRLLDGYIGQSLHAKAQLYEEKLKTALQGLVVEMQGLAGNSLLSNGLTDDSGRQAYLAPFLNDYIKANPAVRSIRLSDYEGRDLARAEKPDSSAFYDARLIRRVIDSGKIGSVWARGGAQAGRLIVVYPIHFAPTRTVEGTLSAEIDVPALFRSLLADPPRTEVVRLVRGRTKLLTVAAPQAVGQALLTTRVALEAFAPLAATGLEVEVAVERDAVFAPLFYLAVSYLLLAAVALLVLVFAVRWISRRVTEPLHLLSQDASRIADGEVLGSLHVPEPQDKGEIHDLARALNHMLRAMQTAKSELERRVAERTQELESAREIFSGVLRSAKDILWSSTPDGRFIYISPAIEAITQRPVEAFLAQPHLWSSLVVDEDKHLVSTSAADLLQEKSGTHVYRIARPGGEMRWIENRFEVVFDEDGRAVRLDGIASDITQKMAAQQALEASEKKYREVVDHLKEVVFKTDADGRWLFLNPAWEEITGFSLAESLGRPFLHYVHPDDRKRNLEVFLPLIEGRKTHCRHEVRYLKNDGEICWIEVNARAVHDGERVLGTNGTLSDISQRKAAEAVLRLRERAMSSSSNGITLCDANDPNLPIIYVNPAFERITGYKQDEVLGLNCRFLQRGDAYQPQMAELREALSQHKECKVILRNYRKDGAMFWNELSVSPVRDETGRVTHFVGIQTDITRRKLVEAILQARTRRLNTIFALSPDGFVSFDSDGQLDYINPAFSRMTGLVEQDLLGISLETFDETLRNLCDPTQPYASAAKAAALAAGDGGAAAGTGNLQRRKAERETLHLIRPEHLILQRSVRREADNSAALIFYFRNVTREREVDRMKSDFLSTAAHELRTPMASIFGFAELLLNRRYDEETQRDLLSTIHQQAGRLTELLNELLDLARIEARQSKDFDYRCLPLSPVIRQTLAAFLLPAGRSPVRLTLEDDLPDCLIDPAKIQQALTNVIANAYKFSPDGGEVKMTVHAETLGAQRYVCIAVTDCGIGLTPDQLGHVFERFYRADSSGRIAGTGLGLSVVKEIIELHGGFVKIDSQYGKGTVVALALPAHPPAGALSSGERASTG